MERNKDPEREQYKRALTELIGGRVVAYYPMLARRIGGVKAAVMLSQLIYWSSSKEVRERPGNWIYKSVDEFELETGLNKVEQQNARRILAMQGIIRAEIHGVPRQWYYQVNMDRLTDILMQPPLSNHSHWVRNSSNEFLIEWESHSMRNRSNIGSESHPTLGEFPSQLNKESKITKNKITQETTTTTMQRELTPPKLVVVAWTDAVRRLTEMGIIEKQIPDYIALAQTSGWEEHQLIDLTRQLERQYEKSRACRLLKTRITSDTPSLYGYTNNNANGLTCPVCWTYPCSCDADLDAEEA